MKKKNPLEEMLERIDKMSDEEKEAIYKEARESMSDMDELERLICDTVVSWGKNHQGEDHFTAKMMIGLQKAFCRILIALDESCDDSEHKPSSAFLAMLPVGMALAKKEYDLHKQMEHERLMREGAN